MRNIDVEKKLEKAMKYIQNDTLKAISIYDEILQDEPENVDALNGKGSSLMKLNQMDDAEKIFDKSLSIKKTSSALISKGIINKTKKDYEQSLNYYDEAIHLNPHLNNIVTILKNEIFSLINGEWEINLGKYACEATELIKKGIEYKNTNKLWDALDCYQKAIDIDGNCMNSVKALKNEIKTTLQNELMIKTPKLGDTRLDQMKLQSLKLLLVEENPKKALTIMNLILEKDENEIDTLNQKGCVLFLFDKCQQSIECFDKCLSIDENYLYAVFNKGLTLRRLNKLTESLECFDRLLKLPKCENKVKPYQLEILEKLHEKDN